MEKEEIEERPTKAILPQVYLSCACCLVGISYGMSAGHSAVLLPHLQSGNSSLVIDEETGSWIASVYAIAGPIGCLFGGISMDFWGRKKLNIFGNAGMLVGWLLITFAENVSMLIFGRVLEGFSRSILATCITVLVDELADPKFRGFIVCSMFTCVSIGIMAIASLGAIVDWRLASGLAAMLSVINLIAFSLLAESPTWFVRKNRMQEAERVLQWLWGPGNNLNATQELADLTARLGPKEDRQVSCRSSREIVKTVRRFFVPRILKPFFIIHSFNVFQAVCGLGIFTYFTVDIISKSRHNGIQIMDDYSTTILISGVRVVTILISSFMMLKVGRRVLATVSGVLSCISSLCLAIILFLHKLENGSPIPAHTDAVSTFTLVLLYAGSMSFGYFSLPSIMIGETQPSNVRGFACGYIYSMNDLLLGTVVKLYPWMLATLQIHGLFLMFGISCLACSIFVYLFLPETQGLTLQQIEDYFRQPNIMWITRNKYKSNSTEEIDISTSRNMDQSQNSSHSSRT